MKYNTTVYHFLYAQTANSLNESWKVAVFIIAIIVVSIAVIVSTFFSLRTLYGKKTKKFIVKIKSKMHKEKNKENKK